MAADAEADLPERLATRLRAPDGLLPRGRRILVALSGGPDSTALLLLLTRLAPDFGWRLAAAHFDHGVRPGGAERAAELGRRIEGLRLGVPLVTGVPDRALEPTHAAMRRARYAWLRATARRLSAIRVATAHHRDDQAETVLFHILRGSGNRGLAGIPVRRGLFVRPLLDVEREELRSWLAATGVPAFDDPSNSDPRYARSRLRHALLPALESAAGGGIADRLVAIGRTAGEVRRWTDRVAALVLASLERGGTADWPPELRAEALRLAGRRHGVRVRGGAAREAARAMLDLTSGHALDLGGGLRLEREFDRWRVVPATAAPLPDRHLEIREPGTGAGIARLAGLRRRVRWLEAGLRGEAAALGSGGTRVALYVPRDHFPLTIRARIPGDRLHLPGGSKALGRLMGEARIPVARRASIPVVADREGRLLCALAPELADRIDREAAENANLIIEVEDA